VPGPSNGRQRIEKKKLDRAADVDAETLAVEAETEADVEMKGKPRSGKEMSRKKPRVTVPAEHVRLLYERLGMATGDCEGKTMNKLQLLPAEQIKHLQRVNLCGVEEAAIWRERSAMRAADMETYVQERLVMANELRASERRAECLAKRLHWHENLRDTVQSLARAHLLQRQGLPGWIVLEGKNLK
jgi:hypothetical protein